MVADVNIYFAPTQTNFGPSSRRGQKWEGAKHFYRQNRLYYYYNSFRERFKKEKMRRRVSKYFFRLKTKALARVKCLLHLLNRKPWN